MRRFGNDGGRVISGLQLLCGDPARGPQPGPTQSCTRTVVSPGVIRSVAGHMHLLGRSITVVLNAGTPGARALLDNRNYNFDHQNAVWLPTPAAVKPGDRLTISCTHDAALRSQLPQLSTLPPRYVVWGEGTSDEMCLGILSMTSN
jgi:Copper type II ascorbate-dependent monooxygenase, C-terminal domain